MGVQESGLSLEGLAHKLEALQRESAERLETLERENADLRHKVAALEGSGTRRDEIAKLRGSGPRRSEEPAPESNGLVSRWTLLSKAAAAAVAAVAAGTLLTPREAKADHFPQGHLGVDNISCHRLVADGQYFNGVHGLSSSNTRFAVFGKHNGPGTLFARSTLGPLRNQWRRGRRTPPFSNGE